MNELEQALQLAQVQLVSRQEAIDKLFKEKYGPVENSKVENVTDGGKDKGKIKDDAGYFDSYSGNGELFFAVSCRTKPSKHLSFCAFCVSAAIG